MDYIIFNGISSTDMGFIIEQLPDEHKPKRITEQIQIPGRHGRIVEDMGAYDQYNTDCRINCNGHAPTEVYAWLKSEGWLTTSQDPEYMRWVSFYEQQQDDRFRLGAGAGECFDTIRVPMIVQPYKYLAVQEEIELESAAVFDGSGNDSAEPILAVTGTGDINLMVNGATILLDDLSGTIYIDCDAKTAYMVEDNIKTFAGRKVTIIDDVWPYLEPGTDANSINWSGSVSKVKIQPWWRWI